MRPKVLQEPIEWHQCLQAGSSAVRRTYELPQFRRAGSPRLSIYHIPSFHDCYGWTVYQKRGEFKLQTVTWRQSVDSQRMEDLMTGRISHAAAEPTVEESLTDIDGQWIAQRLAALAEIRIPLVSNHGMGLDGETFGVYVPNQFDVEWWCNDPPEWNALAQWTYACIDTFRQRSND